jgi:hypothetical protein
MNPMNEWIEGMNELNEWMNYLIDIEPSGTVHEQAGIATQLLRSSYPLDVFRTISAENQSKLNKENLDILKLESPSTKTFSTFCTFR